MISFSEIGEDLRKRWEMLDRNDKATAIAVAFPDVVFVLGYLSARLAVTYAFEKRDDNFIPFGFHVFAALAVAKYC